MSKCTSVYYWENFIFVETLFNLLFGGLHFSFIDYIFIAKILLSQDNSTQRRSLFIRQSIYSWNLNNHTWSRKERRKETTESLEIILSFISSETDCILNMCRNVFFYQFIEDSKWFTEELLSFLFSNLV